MDDLAWMPIAKRYEIADNYKERFRHATAKAGMVEEHPELGSFCFLRGSDLLAASRLPRFGEIRDKLVPYDVASSNRHFVSHRWLDSAHPDPTGAQLALLKRTVTADAHYWVDYCCLPQRPRTSIDEQAFRRSLALLPSLMFKTNFIILRDEHDRYFRRAWCFFESLAANVLGGEIRYAHESPTMRALVEGEERQAMEKALLLERSLPAELEVTDPLDLEGISDAAETLRTFLRLRVVEHYLGLGQTLSSDKLFWGEDPYYFLATCDFSEVLRWSFQHARQNGMRLVELSRDYTEKNFFERLAAVENFEHTVDPYAFPKKVVLDESRLGWFIVNKHARTSAAHLFYILTSMIR